MSLNTAETKMKYKVKYNLFNSKFLHRKKPILTEINRNSYNIIEIKKLQNPFSTYTAECNTFYLKQAIKCHY